jgi:hypothetical protein
MKTTMSKVWLIIFGTVAAAVLGCSGRDLPELGTVKGKVTMAGKPMPNVSVQFHPESGGPPRHRNHGQRWDV